LRPVWNGGREDRGIEKKGRKRVGDIMGKKRIQKI